jgi:hypothetical protein
MSRLIYIVSLLFIANSSCGVKGPPEPPLPTEASLEKQAIQNKEKAVVAEPVSQKVPAIEKTNRTAPKKKSKNQ